LAALSLSAQTPSRTSNFHIGATGISIQFFDHVRGKQPKFISAGNCFLGSGDACHEEPGMFIGAFALVHFAITGTKAKTVHEKVKLIDKEDHLPEKPIFERTAAIKDGIWSDVQLFGYQTAVGAGDDDHAWLFFRQQLFLDDETTPFLILHWRHNVNEITLIDVIQGMR
jgi:hypothetical protein